MNTAQEEFLQSLDGGDLTAQQAAHLLEIGDTQGDTVITLTDEGGKPDASAGEADKGAAASEADKNASTTNADAAKVAEGTAAAEPDATNTVILAKDGKHTIGYEKLVEAREAAANAKTLLDAANQELITLRADAQKRAESGEAATKLDNQVAVADAAIAAGADASLFGDFSEEALTKGISKLVETQVAARVQAALAPLNAKLEPIQAKQAVDATTAHYQQIYEKHPDADSVAESKELADWIATQPSFARAGYQAALEKGSTSEVIELFDTFKAATGKTQAAAAPADKVDVKEAAKTAIANAKPVVPASLTDFPGGRVGAGTREEAMSEMTSGTDLLASMENMSKEQIENYLNRNL